MCNVDGTLGALTTARILYIAMVALAASSAAACLGFFSAVAAPGLMLGAAGCAAGAAIAFGVALGLVNGCTGPCAQNLDDLRGWLIEEIAVMAGIGVGLAALALVVCVPIAGGIAAGAAMFPLLIGCGVLGAIEAALSAKVVMAFDAFNSCQTSAGQPHTTGGVIFTVLSAIAGVVGGLLSLVGGLIVAPIIAVLIVGAAAYGWSFEFTVDDGSDSQDPPNPIASNARQLRSRRTRFHMYFGKPRCKQCGPENAERSMRTPNKP